MATVFALTERTEAQRLLVVRDDEWLWGDLRPELCEAVRVILEMTESPTIGVDFREPRSSPADTSPLETG